MSARFRQRPMASLAIARHDVSKNMSACAATGLLVSHMLSSCTHTHARARRRHAGDQTRAHARARPHTPTRRHSRQRASCDRVTPLRDAAGRAACCVRVGWAAPQQAPRICTSRAYARGLCRPRSAGRARGKSRRRAAACAHRVARVPSMPCRVKSSQAVRCVCLLAVLVVPWWSGPRYTHWSAPMSRWASRGPTSLHAKSTTRTHASSSLPPACHRPHRGATSLACMAMCVVARCACGALVAWWRWRWAQRGGACAHMLLGSLDEGVDVVGLLGEELAAGAGGEPLLELRELAVRIDRRRPARAQQEAAALVKEIVAVGR
jgi:hypothetical protein